MDGWNSDDSEALNNLLNGLLREAYIKMSNVGEGKNAETHLQSVVRDCTVRVQGILDACLGRPPLPFLDFEWAFKRKEDAAKGGGTCRMRTNALGLFKVASKVYNVADFVTLVHCPSNKSAKELGVVYSVNYLNNMQDTPASRYLSVGEKDLRAAAQKCIRSECPVWFGCEFGTMTSYTDALLHSKAYNMAVLTGSEEMSKADAVDSFHSVANHAMLITGMHEVSEGEAPVRWQVENSHGDDGNEQSKGYFSMSTCWLDRYAYVLAVPRSCLTLAQTKALNASAVLLDPWDTIGSLATVW